MNVYLLLEPYAHQLHLWFAGSRVLVVSKTVIYNSKSN